MKDYTMIPRKTFLYNLDIINKFKKTKGCIVECGTWRGGMIGGIACMLSKEKEYFLFDSFEGLPLAKEIDGKKAIEWQSNKDGKYYFENCKAEMKFAENAMKISGAKNYKLIKGWFDETLPKFKAESNKIAILRLDGDWYDSTMCCLDNLYPLVVENGIIIIDDYYAWEGCSKAVHDYLSKNNLSVRINQWKHNLCYIIKE